jgi:Uma2 family endonuclease
MMQIQHKVTLDEFMEFVHRPENSSHEFEFIDGRIVEKMPGRASNSQIQTVIVAEVRPFCKAHGIPCYTTAADGAFNVLGHVFAPDFSYRKLPFTGAYPEPEPPLWVVEVISPTEESDDIESKREVYLQARLLYWEIYPKLQRVVVYTPDQPRHTYGAEDMLDVGALIPGFTLAVRDLFV